MSRKEIEQMCSKMEIDYYPRGGLIMRQGEKIPDYVYIIQTGSINLTISDESGGEILVDVRNEGDVVGALSILKVKKALFDVRANEDVIAYLLPAEDFLQIVKKYPEIEQYFSYSLAGNVKMARHLLTPELHRVMTTNTLNLDMFLLGKFVADLMVKSVLTCLPDRSIRDAVKSMTLWQVSSIIIVQASGNPIGILTDRDLRQKVLAKGCNIDVHVTEVMSSPLQTIDPTAYAFDAVLKMSHHGIRHLVVVENERLVGILSEHDIHVETGNSPVGVIGDIDKSSSMDDLINLRHKIDQILEILVIQGVPARKSTELITEMNDRVTQKIIKFTEQRMEENDFGPPPVPYCWMALGSEGRSEQTFRTDQDNALLFENVPGAEREKIKDWFLMYSEWVVDGLVLYGFPRCRGGIMASNSKWCNSREQWESIFSGWIIHPEALTLRMASIFFDFRSIYGYNKYVDSLREKINNVIDNHKTFLRYLAKSAINNHPPIGFLRQFVVEKSGEHKDQLDLKMRGTLPVIESARVLALEMHVSNSNTVERLKEVSKKEVIDGQLLLEVIEAYDFITSLRLNNHLEARKIGASMNNFINPSKLSALQRTLLKESFSVINRLQEQLEYRYNSNLLLDV
jgi:CBS domain-containing protein